MSAGDKEKRYRIIAQDDLTRNVAALKRTLDAAAEEEAEPASLPTLRRQIAAVNTKYEELRAHSKAYLDKLKVTDANDQNYIDEKTIIDNELKTLEVQTNKAQDIIDTADKEAATDRAKQTELPRIQALVTDYQARAQSRISAVDSAFKDITGTAQLPMLATLDAWLIEAENMVIDDVLAAMDQLKGVDIATNRATHEDTRTTYLEEQTRIIQVRRRQIVDKRIEIMGASRIGTPAPSEAGDFQEAAPSEPRQPRGYSGMASLYSKQPLPSFDGQLKNYLSFRSAWKRGPGSAFPYENQKYGIMQNIPKFMAPRIKNLISMTQIWDSLNAEFGNASDLVVAVNRELAAFKYSSEKAADSKKFLELYDKYVQIKQDLTEVKRQSELDTVNMQQLITNKLPLDLRKEYAAYRVLKRTATSTESSLLNSFMEAQREIQRDVERLNYTQSGSDKPVCGFCDKPGHDATACWKKHGKPDNSGGGKAGKPKKTANQVDMSKPHKPCPCCSSHHTFTPKGKKDIFYKSRLSACDIFKNKSVEERAALVEQVGACALCLDWTGDHKRDKCDAKLAGQPFPRCDVTTSNLQCGKPHNKLLHGTTRSYCLYTRIKAVNQVKSGMPTNEESLFAPTQDEVLMDTNVMMPLQSVIALGRAARQILTVAWDKGSTCALIKKSVALSLNLPGTPVTLSLQTAGNPFEDWNTTGYHLHLVDKDGIKHKILAYEMDNITSEMDEVDTAPIAAIFAHLGVTATDLIRPSGPVDLLMGINYASLHPYDDSTPRVDGELKLLRSNFGTGWVIEGYHPSVNQSPVFVNQLTYRCLLYTSPSPRDLSTSRMPSYG